MSALDPGLLMVQCRLCGAPALVDGLTFGGCPHCGHNEAERIQPREPICDLCGLGPVVRTYETRPITISVVDQSDGGTIAHTLDSLWCACGPCSVLIDAGDADSLFARSWALHPDTALLEGPDVADAQAVVRIIHAQFFANLKRGT